MSKKKNEFRLVKPCRLHYDAMLVTPTWPQTKQSKNTTTYLSVFHPSDHGSRIGSYRAIEHRIPAEFVNLVGVELTIHNRWGTDTYKCKGVPESSWVSCFAQVSTSVQGSYVLNNQSVVNALKVLLVF